MPLPYSVLRCELFENGHIVLNKHSIIPRDNIGIFIVDKIGNVGYTLKVIFELATKKRRLVCLTEQIR